MFCMRMDNSPGEERDEVKRYIKKSCGFFGSVRTCLVPSTGFKSSPHLEFEYFKKKQYAPTGCRREMPKPEEPVTSSNTAKQTQKHLGDIKPVGKETEEKAFGADDQTAAKKRYVFRTMSHPELKATNTKITVNRVSCSMTSTEGAGNFPEEQKSPPPDVVPKPQNLPGPDPYNPATDISERNLDSLKGSSNSNSDDDTTGASGSTAGNGYQPPVKPIYQRLCSEPVQLSQEVLQGMVSQTPSFSRSKSYHLQRQKTPVQCDFTPDDKRAKHKRYSSSGYGTESKDSSTDRASMDVPDQPEQSVFLPQQSAPVVQPSVAVQEAPLPTILELFHDSLAVVRPTSFPLVAENEPNPAQIPTMVCMHSVSPLNSHQGASLESVELPQEFYIDDISINEIPIDSNAETISTREIDQFDISQIDQEALRQHQEASDNTVHDTFALSIIETPTPSMASRGFYYDEQISEGVGVPEEELNRRLKQGFQNVRSNWITEQIQNGASLADIDERLSFLLEGDIEEDCADGPAGWIGIPETVRTVAVPHEIRCIEMASQCPVAECTSSDCQFGQYLLEILGKTYNYSLENDKSIFCRGILKKIYHHSFCCDKPNCPVPWCGFFHSLEESDSFSDVMQLFKKEFFPSTLGYTYALIDEDNAQFIQCQDEGYDSLPSQDTDYHVCTRLCPYKDAFLALGIDNSLIILNRKKFRRESVTVLHELRKMKNKHLIPHLWAATTMNISPCVMLTSTPDQGFTVRDKMRQLGADGFDSDTCKALMVQLKDVSVFMRGRGFMYLNWSGEHVCLSRDHASSTYQIVLFNFANSSTVLMDKREVAERLSIYLAPNQIPPEVFRNEEVSFPASDYWGMGCLLYEICVGQHLYHEARHLSYEEQKTEVESKPVPDLTSVSAKGGDVLASVKNLLRKIPEQRKFDLPPEGSADLQEQA